MEEHVAVGGVEMTFEEQVKALKRTGEAGIKHIKKELDKAEKEMEEAATRVDHLNRLIEAYEED